MAIKMRIKELIAIKERRENRRLTIRTIAQETGLVRNTVAGYMNNTTKRLDIPILEIWQKYLGVSAPELFVDETEITEQVD